jgi:ParB/RepB/Spo0J family partition protein
MNQPTTPAETIAPVLTANQIIDVPIDLLVPDPNQPRTEFDQASLKALAAELRTKGSPEQPLLVRSDFVIKDGERRWRAARIAGLTSLPCLLAKPAADENPSIEWQMDQACVNHHRDPLGPMDWARFLRKLVDQFQVPVKDIGELLRLRGIDMSRPHISNMMRLTELPTWAQDMINAEKITPAHGKYILTAKDSAEVMQRLQGEINEWLEDGFEPLTTQEVLNLVVHLYRKVHLDLHGYGEFEPAFDTDTCKGCINRKVIKGEFNENVFCLNKICFDEKQEAARAADNKKTPAGDKKTEEFKAALKKGAEQSRLNIANYKAREKAKALGETHAIAAIVAKVDGKPSLQDLREIAGALIDYRPQQEIAERRGWKLPRGNWHSAFQKQIAGLQAAELHGLLLEAATLRLGLEKTATRYGVDLKALTKAALAEIKKTPAKKSAKAKGGKAKQ